MLRMRGTQLDALSANMLASFECKSAEFLADARPAWAKERSEAEINAFVWEVIDFGRNHMIFAERNLQTLMLFRIDSDFSTPLEGYHHMVLTADGETEGQRIADFKKAFRNGAPLRRLKFEDLGL
jgi:hypothetical protein